MYSLKKMTQKISKTYTLSFPKAAHSLEAQDQGGQAFNSPHSTSLHAVLVHRPVFHTSITYICITFYR